MIGMAELQDSASINVSNALAVLEFLFLFFWCSGFGVKVAQEEASNKKVAEKEPSNNQTDAPSRFNCSVIGMAELLGW